MNSSGATPDDDAIASHHEAIATGAEASVRSAPGKSSGKSNLNDHLANQRTLLAWARTGIAIIALGFVVARFGLLLRELGATHAHTLPSGVSSGFGIALTVFGAALIGLSLVRYLRIARGIEAGNPHISPVLDIGLSVGLVAAGLVLAVYLALTA